MSEECLFPADNTENLKNKGHYEFLTKDDFDTSTNYQASWCRNGRYEGSVACKFSFCQSGPKMYAKVAPNIIDCRLLAVRFFS